MEKPSDPEKLRNLVEVREGPELDPYESIVRSPEDRNLLQKHDEEINKKN